MKPFPYPEVFCDTSFLFALLSKRDANHRRAKRWARQMERQKTTCWTTWDVISETLTLLIVRHSYAAAMAFLDHIEPSLAKMEYGDDLREKAKTTFRRFNKDHAFSFCDCLSYHIIRDLLHHIPALAFDEDFKKMGLTVV